MNLDELNNKDIEGNINKKALEGYEESIIEKEKEINKAEDSDFRYLAYSLTIAALDRMKIAEKIIEKIILSSLLDVDFYNILNELSLKPLT